MRSSWLVVTLALATVGILTLPGALASGGAGPGGSLPTGGASVPGSNLTVNATLTLGNGASNFTSPILLGTTVTPRAPLLPNQAALVNATPQGAIVWPGGNAGDTLDPLGNYTAGPTNGTGHVAGVMYTSDGQFVHPETNESAFVAWCKSVHCTAIFQVPGELNNSAIARDIVAYTVNTTYRGPVWVNETNITKGIGDPLGTELNVTMPGLNFTPAYWEIGNEPVFWHHWNQPWGATYDTGNVSATVYGQLVESYELAMDQANTSYIAKIIAPPGIGSGAPPTPWINAILNDTGGDLAGVAMHNYAAGTGDPNGKNVPGSIAQFEESFAPKSGLYSSIQTEAAQIRSLCHMYGRNCTLPLFVTEVGPALSHGGYGPFSATFPGALAEADQAIQAMDFSASTLATTNIFSTVSDSANSWFNLSGSARPSYTVYSQFLNHLGNDAFPVRATNGVVTKGTDQTLNALATIAPNDSDRHDLFVVNTNVSSPSVFSTNFINSSYVLSTSPAFPATFKNGAPVEVWEWSGGPPNATVRVQTSQDTYPVLYNTSDPATPDPIPAYYPHGLPSTFSVPPLSLALFETYNAPAYPVQFEESGLSLAPPNLSAPNLTARWFLDVDGTNTSTNATNITLLLPPGIYPTSAAPVLIPTLGHVLVPKERYYPVLPSNTVVGNSPKTVIVSYIQQWALNLSWNAKRGTVLIQGRSGATGPPSDGQMRWVNDSEPIELTFQPSPTYAFDRWDGEGGGSFSGYSPMATLAPTSPLEEQAIFLNGTPVTFVQTPESQLPPGIAWNVSMRAINDSTTSPSLTFEEIQGTWAFNVSAVSVRNASTGLVTVYRVVQTMPDGTNVSSEGGSVTVGPAPVQVGITYVALTPPEERYPVTFIESGLSAGTRWSVTVANGTTVESRNSSTTDSILVEAPIGNFSYVISNVSGYHIDRTSDYGLIRVTGVPLIVTVLFERLFPVTFTESGLAPGTNWSVTVAGGSPLAASGMSSGPTIVLAETNGTWGFVLPNVTGYHINRTVGYGSLNVSGAPVTVSVDFEILYAISFVESGLPTGALWTVRVAFTTPLSASNSSTTPTVIIFEPNGHWGYVVPNVVVGQNAAFGLVSPDDVSVVNANATVDITFQPIAPVVFEETGLPSGVTWDVSAGYEGHAPRAPGSANGFALAPATITLAEPPGSWGFMAWAIGNRTSNWRVVTVPHLEFNVTSISPVIVHVQFRPGYPIVWKETGLERGLNWSVQVGGATNRSNGPDGWTYSALNNGSYAFTIPDVAPDWVPIPSHGSIVVDGASFSFDVQFVQATFPVTFAVTGLPSGAQYSLRLSNINATSSAASYVFQIPNSTYLPPGHYTFDLVPPAGYYATPAGGNVTVGGHPVTVAVSILPIGRGPTPPVLTLAVPAAVAAVALVLAGTGMYSVLGAIHRRRTGASL